MTRKVIIGSKNHNTGQRIVDTYSPVYWVPFLFNELVMIFLVLRKSWQSYRNPVTSVGKRGLWFIRRPRQSLMDIIIRDNILYFIVYEIFRSFISFSDDRLYFRICIVYSVALFLMIDTEIVRLPCFSFLSELQADATVSIEYSGSGSPYICVYRELRYSRAKYLSSSPKKFPWLGGG